MTAFLKSDLVTLTCGLFGAWLAVFGSDPLATVIAVLLIVNLLFAIAINRRNCGESSKRSILGGSRRRTPVVEVLRVYLEVFRIPFI